MESVDSLDNEIGTADLEAQSLCTSCGLCCNGSIFKHASLKEQDKDSFLENVQITPVKRDNKRFFLQPCHHLNNKKCQIYQSWRPHVCSGFRCKVLKRFYRAEISYEQALNIIKGAVLHAEDVRRQLTFDISSDTMSLAMLFEAWKTVTTGIDVSIELNYTALQFRFGRDFKIKKQDS